ncbi:rab-GTPase-TBC domain-domain-containing protein [Lobosporangium transversale]|uniref:Rab-GTPase-TBC domain-domain-containing protein n=1 Tax=Lobosporangium transversale TaxID=64571 RepID=A0A1Y2GZV9_9FUNG|nr:rab-GTPase-TBC domain-domain-containing protein [Lobosporangium transversale]ORZ26993.1 rab-GTPase-TBC domain-domain-containing protein [Lobosporangium transversale]|eukprot:XP_021884740.1 rab-GTPase-TBC domain-domain-containing protein [Lobosporangium transversale]
MLSDHLGGYIDIISSQESTFITPPPSPSSISTSSRSNIDPSIEQHKIITSYVPISTHNTDPAATSLSIIIPTIEVAAGNITTKTAAAAEGVEADLNRRRGKPLLQLQQLQRQQAQYQQENAGAGMFAKRDGDEEEDKEGHRDQCRDNMVAGSNRECNSGISLANEDSDMTSPTRHPNESLPNSASTRRTTASSGSTTQGRRKIAESSMILGGGAGTSTMSGNGGGGDGSLSPAWSMTSIPRDISAFYGQHYMEQGGVTEITPTAPVDETLYGLVDRYGFLVEEGRTPTADRDSAHSSTPSMSRRSVRASIEPKIHAKMIEKEQERSLKWAKMARQYTSAAMETEYTFTNNSKFVKRVYKGIPDCWRAAAWSFLITKRSSGFEPNIRQIYHNMLEISSPEEEQIDLDIPRTMHGHIMFRTRYGPGQCSLFKVLKAYSNYNHCVGYCQGMASIVATMLTFFDEEKTFVLLAQLFSRYGINDLVIPGFPALFEAFYIQEELTKIYAPRVFEALQAMGIATASYASRWYITLYSAGVVPHRTLLRIWDVFLLEGFDWLYFMALALLKYYESSLIQKNFEQTMEKLNAKMDIQDDDLLLKIAQKLLKQARQTGIVAKLRARYAASQQRTASTARPTPVAS